MKDKYEFVAGEERAQSYSVRKMCAWLKVSRSGYHTWKDPELGPAEVRRLELATVVSAAFEHSDGTYGYRRVHAQLARWGRTADPETVRKLMRAQGLQACQPRPFRPRTTVAADVGQVTDLLRRDFTADAPGLKWVGDITYIPTREGFAFLATVLDCFSRKVVGYAIAEHMRTDLIVAALNMAARQGIHHPGKTIFHSDHGAQYISRQFADLTDSLGITRSLGAVGTCYDNAWAESFNATLKNERCHRIDYATIEEAARDVTSYIELRYNQQRLHSTLGYRTPNEVEHEWHQTQQAA